MPTHKYYIPSIFVVLLSIGQGVVGNELEPEAEVPPTIDWPAAPQPRSEVFHMEVELDGPPEKRLVIDCGKFALTTTNFGKWEENKKMNPRYSIQLSPNGNNDIRFGLARFPGSDFITSLEATQWDGYVESLKQHPSPRIIHQQRYSVERKAAPIVLNELPYRVIDYEYKDADENAIRSYELFTFIDGELFVFALSGPIESVAQYQERVNLMISRMERL